MARADELGTPIRMEAPTNLHELTLPDVLQALADPTRLSIVRQLAQTPDGSKCVGEFELDASKQNLSHHLRVLWAAGFIDGWYVGRKKYIRLRRAEMDRIFPGVLGGVLQALEATPSE